MLSNFKGALYYASLDRSLLKNYRHSKKAPLTIEIRVEIEIKTNEKNRTVTIGRDIMGRVIKETSPSGREVGYVWGTFFAWHLFPLKVMKHYEIINFFNISMPKT